jgi:dCTP deaminase
MTLSDRDIKKAIRNGTIKLTPKINYSQQLGSCSVDLRLSNVFRITRKKEPNIFIKKAQKLVKFSKILKGKNK